MKISESLVRALPKVLLHDHLDGGLRPGTVIELARDVGYKGLPTEDPLELAAWFHRKESRGDLPLYLEGFRHTCAVMQTEEGLERVAYEMMEDARADGPRLDERFRAGLVFRPDLTKKLIEIVNDSHVLRCFSLLFPPGGQ